MGASDLILAFDTSASYCAAALLGAGQVLVTRHIPMARGQGEALMPLLEETLDQADRNWGDLTGLAVGTGPGNFTGIRISVSASRGLSMALSVPALGVSMLEALAHGVQGPVLTCLDAYKDHVYLQSFTDGTSVSDAMLVALSQVGQIAVEGNPVAVGPAAGDVAARLGLVEISQHFSPAEAIGLAAFQRIGANSGPPVPYYVRPPDAAPPRDPPPAMTAD